jgi:hypothetical protein
MREYQRALALPAETGLYCSFGYCGNFRRDRPELTQLVGDIRSDLGMFRLTSRETVFTFGFLILEKKKTLLA